MTKKEWSSVRWSKWIIVGGACIASGAAIWWHMRKQSRNVSFAIISKFLNAFYVIGAPEKSLYVLLIRYYYFQV